MPFFCISNVSRDNESNDALEAFGQIDKLKIVSIADKLSAAKGSNHFANSKTALRVVTISLFSIGVIMASILAYQQLTKPEMPQLFSKEEAVQIALKAGKWDERKATGEMQIEATLVHVQPNGFSLKVDETTLRDLPIGASRFGGYENRYIWLVDIFAPNNTGNRDTHSWIDAETGQVLLQG